MNDKLRRLNLAFCSVVILFVAFPSEVTAKPPFRIWVDSTGRYSVEAALVERVDARVILVRKDGGKLSMPIKKLSTTDLKYLVDSDSATKEKANQLRLAAPKAPSYEPLPELDLIQASFTAPENAELMLGVVTNTTRQVDLPKSIAADPAPYQLKFPKTIIGMDKIDAYDKVSRLVSVGDDEKSFLGMSITTGFSLPGVRKLSQLMRFDPVKNSTEEVYSSNESITLFDHHRTSGRSLVLVGHNPLGHGGRLAIATGWKDGRVEVSHERKIPSLEGVGEYRHLRWARWIDDENVVALLDDSLVRWNIVSGETFYRIDGIDLKSNPALSGGRRFLAVPMDGGVALLQTTDAKPLGRLRVSSTTMPGVAFARHGGALAVTTSRRLVTWDLTSATLTSDIESRRSLGYGSPVWVDHDLVLGSSGVLLSIHRGVPIWRYQIAGTVAVPLGERVALFRKHPKTGIAIMRLPHQGAKDAIEWMDEAPENKDPEGWTLPGRSVWNMQGWSDREVRISLAPETKTR